MRVLAAMSGGVDSSVAAGLLVQAGHEVIGVTMRLWGGESDTGCCSVSEVEDARRVAHRLGIDHHVFNFAEEFEQHVVEPYVRDHAEGRTPNPCIECNRRLKFDKLLRRADALGFDAVATGHHARLATVGPHRFIRRGADPAKDQSYVLYPMAQCELSQLLLPIGDLTKAEVRRIAAEMDLPTATKPESQDVCFITRAAGRAAFLERRIPLHPATVVDGGGAVVGSVDAVELVTIGQRRGLELAGGADRRYVTDVDVPGRRVTVGGPADLLRESVVVRDVVWAADPVVDDVVEVQWSAHGTPAVGRVLVAGGGHNAVSEGDGGHPTDGSGDAPSRVEIRWAEPQRRIAAGQSVVFYRGDVVVGGGLVAADPVAMPRRTAS